MAITTAGAPITMAGGAEHPSDSHPTCRFFCGLERGCYLMGVLGRKALQTADFLRGTQANRSVLSDYYAEPSDWLCIAVPKRGRKRSFADSAKGRFRPQQELLYTKGVSRIMLFSKRDIDALRLLCWCQYMCPEDLSKLLSEEERNNLHLPVHLLSCDDTGAVQLQIMSVPDYRQRLTRAALRSHYQSPIKTWFSLQKKSEAENPPRSRYLYQPARSRYRKVTMLPRVQVLSGPNEPFP